MRRMAWSFLLPAVLASACGTASEPFPRTAQTARTGHLVVSSTGSNVVAEFDVAGSLAALVRDFNNAAETPYGVVVAGDGSSFVVVDGVDRVENIATSGTISTVINNASLTSVPPGGIARDPSGNIYVVESSINTIEKFSAAGARQGNPFINTAVTTGAVTCTLSTPRGIAYVAGDRLAVASSGNGRLLIYDVNGGCVASITAAPFGSNAPYGVAYDSANAKIIVTFNTSSAVVATNTSGAGAQTIYLNTTVILTPTGVVADGAGGIYVANTGLDTIEKLAYAGGATATRVGGTPWVGPSVYLRDPWGIAIVP